MRIACLQFAPQVGDIEHNLSRADAVLNRANPQNLDLLVLPELAFTGYNFNSLQDISPYLEHTASGISSLWARTTALKYNCFVTVGYPEKVDITPKWPADPEYYNSTITVNPDGETIAHYRKTHLYYTDETWALEGPDGFYSGEIHGLGNVAMGICMDLNPYRFEAPWHAFEFAFHILHRRANLVIVSMAWLTRQDAHQFSITPRDPDLETLSYWLARLEPLIRAEQTGEIIVVFANRTGMEGSAVYAGTSAVIGIHDGEVKLYGVLGRGERELLLVDTDLGPQAKLVSDPVPPPTTETTQSRSTPQSHGSHETRATTPEPDTEFLVSIDGVLSALSPVSPVSAKYPSTYFPSPTSSTAGRKGKILESSLHNKNSTIASPDPERQERPTSMIQTTSSRERTPEWEEQSAINSDLINSDVTATSHADHDPKTSQNEQSEQIPEKESVIYTNGDDYGIGGPFTAPMSNIPGLRITEKTPSPTLPAEGPRNHQVGQLGERESLKERPRSVAW